MKSTHMLLAVFLLWTWSFWWPAALFDLHPALIAVGGLGILVIAMISAARDGSGALREMFAASVRWKTAPARYGVALFPAILIFTSILAIGLIQSPDGFSIAWPGLAAIPILVLAWVEEVTWRGYVLQRLLAQHSATKASLILGVFWMFWHMPLYWAAGYNEWGSLGYLAWAPFYFVYTFFLTWLYLKTGRSVLIATLSHFGVNLAVASATPYWLENVGAIGAAILLVPALIYLFRRNFGSPFSGQSSTRTGKV